ncbi:kinase-like domain-containing protein [Ochromonadaceae sp. CCMP2298]|nr:kinase-like domain-containing protein [Ochromonadaceae sp. CCMP2298]
MRLREARVRADKARAASSFLEAKRTMEKDIRKFHSKYAKVLKEANSLDLAIAMDCTGSMGSWMGVARDKMIDLIQTIKADNANCSVRVAYIGYRDFCDGAERLAVAPFTTDSASITAFIARQTAQGGGDAPEDVAGALQTALGLAWQSAAKLLIWIGDAPCHGVEYHDYGDAGDSEVSKKGMINDPCVLGQMRQFATRGIDFQAIQIKPDQTQKMIDKFKAAYAASALPEDGIARTFMDTKLASADIGVFTKLVSSSASRSLSASKSRSVSTLRHASKRGPRPLGVSSLHHYGPTGRLETLAEAEDESASSTTPLRTPSWSDLDPLVKAVRHTFHKSPDSVMDWSDPQLRLTSQATEVRISSSHFAKGAMREARCMYDKTMNRDGVAKVYFKTSGTKALMSKDTEAQAIAKLLALEFSASKGNAVTIDYIFTSFYELPDLPPGHPMKYFAYEPYIPGEYKKYNNNNGWINPEFGDTAQAFSHFTWQHTGGNLIVVDLQGVNFILTDPQIHSRDLKKYGAGNLGAEGMASFFSSHVCNDACRHLALDPVGTVAGVVRTPGLKGADVEILMSKSILAREVELSCTLCGSFHKIARAEFVTLHDAGREVMCKPCSVEVEIKTELVCRVAECGKTVPFSAYWYMMKGMEAPKSCRDCKKKARAAVAGVKV